MLDPRAVDHYRRKLAKTGVALTLSQLEEQLRKLKVPFARRELAAWLARAARLATCAKFALASFTR